MSNPESHLLYNDSVKLLVNHQGRNHRYLVSKRLVNSKWSEPVVVEGITGNLNVIPKDLTGWAAWMASDYWYQVLSNVDFSPDVVESLNIDWKTVRDEASNAHKLASFKGKSSGTDLHTALESHFKDEYVDISEMSVETLEKYHKILAWWDKSGWEAIEAEKPAYSRSLNYATKVDLYARNRDGKYMTINWKSNKTSKTAPDGVYWEHLVQGGGEALALIEQGDPVDEIVIINPNSTYEDGGLKPVLASDRGMSIDDAITVFSQCRALTENIKYFERSFKS